MMSMIVLGFAICWTPIQMFNFVIWLFGKSLKTRTQFQMNVYVSSFFICHWLAMAHSLGESKFLLFFLSLFVTQYQKRYLWYFCVTLLLLRDNLSYLYLKPKISNTQISQVIQTIFIFIISAIITQKINIKFFVSFSI